MESDEGTFKPSGLAFTGNAKARDIIKEIMALLLPINVTDVFNNADGTDINYWMRDGVPGESTLQIKPLPSMQWQTGREILQRSGSLVFQR